MSSDTTTENTGTPEGQAANHSPDGAPPGGDGTGAPASAREAQSAKRYGQMNDAQRARIEAQFDGRERDEAYNRAWCDAVDALWEREGDDTPPTEASATATGTAPDAKGATADRVDPEKFFRAFLGAQSDESRRRLADAIFVLFSKLGAPEGATAAEASKPTAKPEPINWAPLFDGVVAYVGERIADGSAQDFVTNFVDDTIRDAVRDALDERVPEDVHPRLYESVVEFARAAKSPGERMMWVRMARRLERDGEPGFVERMITEWTRARSERVGVVLHTVRDVTERAYEFYHRRREEAARRELDMRHTEVLESGKNLALILGCFSSMMSSAFGHLHGARVPAPEQSASAQTTAGKPPVPPASGSGGPSSFS